LLVHSGPNLRLVEGEQPSAAWRCSAAVNGKSWKMWPKV
jgi:hypothetical protein